MDKKEVKKEIISDLDFMQRLLSRYNHDLKGSHDFNMGIMIGLMLGIFGNALVTLMYDLGIKDWSFLSKSIASLIIIAFISFLFIVSYRDNRKFKRLIDKTDWEIDQIELDKDKIERGLISPTRKELYQKYIFSLNTEK
jgi:hypothetical protein